VHEEELEELKKRFIISEDEERAMLKDILTRIMSYAKVFKNGYVHIEKRNLSKRLKILLAVMARYVAGLLDESISKEISLDEIVAITGASKKEASARLSEFIKEGLITRTEKGKYRATSLHAAEELLDILERKEKRDGDKG